MKIRNPSDRRAKEDIEKLSGRRGTKGASAVTHSQLSGILKTLNEKIRSVSTLATTGGNPKAIGTGTVADAVAAFRLQFGEAERRLYDTNTYIENYVSQTDQALADVNTLVTTLEAETGTNAAAIAQLDYAITDPNGSIAQSFTTLNATVANVNAGVTANSNALATMEGFAGATYVLRLVAGDASGSLELVAADNPIDGPASIFRVSADSILLDGSVRTSMMSIDELLTIDAENAGFSMGKTDPYDMVNDGLYMGRTTLNGSNLGYSFLVGRTNLEGQPEYIQHTADEGLRIVNAEYQIQGIGGSQATITTDGRYDLDPNAEEFSAIVLGGGGGGQGCKDYSSGRNGTAGGTTTATLFDGNGTQVAQWVAAGGASPKASGSGTTGGSSVYGAGGTVKSAVSRTWGGDFNHYDGNNASGNGAGGGGARIYYNAATNPRTYFQGKGGGAGQVVAIQKYDLTSLTNPYVMITIGAGGVGGGEKDDAGDTKGGDGSPGLVAFSEQAEVPQLAGVIARAPGASGAFVLPTGTSQLPDIPPNRGFWSFDLGDAEIEFGDGQVVKHAPFIAPNRGTITNNGAERVIEYAFWPMA